MNAEEAAAFLAGLDAINPYAKKDTPLGAVAALLAQAIPAAPMTWANEFAIEHIKSTGQVPAVADLISGWAAESMRLVETSGEVDPPIETRDPAVWVMWERARRAALVSGANNAESHAAADAAIGVDRSRRTITAAPDGRTWREVALEKVAASRARIAARDEADNDDEGAVRLEVVR